MQFSPVPHQEDQMTIKEHDFFIRWNWMNYGMSADFLEYYANKYPEPPENPFHSDLAMIRDALRSGERHCQKMMRFKAQEPIAGDYQI